jgi:protein-S-isoprenylcysteine O-methyltransferase Ste14
MGFAGSSGTQICEAGGTNIAAQKTDKNSIKATGDSPVRFCGDCCPRAIPLSSGYGAVTTAISFSCSILRIPDSIALPSLVLGITMLAVGIPFYVLSAKAIFRGFAEGRLLTEGVYAACRHPIYGSWIVFIIPGIELILRSWPGLTTVVFAYLLLRLLAGSEEDYLLERFGDSYRQYRTHAPFVLP